MLQINDEFLSIDISAHKLAAPDLANRFCMVDNQDERAVKVEVLVRKTSAHRVSRLALTLGLSWQLVFDDNDGPCIIFKIKAPVATAPVMAKELRKLRFQREYAAAN